MTEPATRHAYRDQLVRLMADDQRLVCLDSDTGLFGGVDFGAATARYLDLGIAEQTLMGVAAGMAAAGWLPFVNTMATFASTRALEAVKIDIAYNAVPVRIVATHGGVSAGHLGPTHHALEDLAVMRTLPNFTVVVPVDARATESIVRQAARLPGPVYLRLGRKATPPVPGLPLPVLGRIQRLLPGRQVVLISCGPLPTTAAAGAAGLLAADGIEAGVLHAHTLAPFDTATLAGAVGDAELVVTVEEHWRTGALGSAVAETLCEIAPRRLLRIGLPDRFVDVVGTPEQILEHHQVSPAGVAGRVRAELGITSEPEGAGSRPALTVRAGRPDQREIHP